MIVGAVVALVIGGAIAAAVIAHSRHRIARRVDAITATLLDEHMHPSAGVDHALARLEHGASRIAEIPMLEHVEAQRYRASLASLRLGVVLIDERGTVAFRNAYASSFIEGRHGDALVGEVIEEVAAAALGGQVDAREVHVHGPPRRTLFVTANPIEEAGVRLGAVVLIDDVTERERLDAIRRDFVANISHELRTPIGAVSLLAETLAAEEDHDVVVSLTARISDEAERLAGIIDDLLQLSRIEHGSDEDFAPIEIQAVVAAAHDRIRAAADQADVEIGVNLPDQELVVRGDAIQLTSALFNLLDNGVKYIGGGGGVISVRAREVDGHVEVTVQDSGIGVPRKDLDRIFERFYRVDPGRRRDGGTGLGLAIVRHVVANHRGRIHVDSTEGEGTTFTLELPVFDLVAEGDGDHEVSRP